MFIGLLLAMLGLGLLIWGLRGFNNAGSGNQLGIKPTV